MTAHQQLIHNILSDIRVELLDEFDNNFKRGGFFSRKWPAKQDRSPSFLTRTGKLRRSITAAIRGNTVLFTSSEPYSEIHNQGGTITVTPQMKKYFWAMFRKTKQPSYKRMALMKTGSKIRIPQRQFIGNSPEIEKSVESIIQSNVTEYLRQRLSQTR